MLKLTFDNSNRLKKKCIVGLQIAAVSGQSLMVVFQKNILKIYDVMLYPA